MTPDESTLARLTAAYQHDPQAFLAEPLQLRWWVHGGEPGSPSDAVTISGVAGAFSATYHRVRFDFAAAPAQQVDEFRQALHADAVRPLLDEMLGGALFRQRFAEEESHEVADARQERWELQFGGQSLAKTFHEPFPHRLTPLRERFADCVRAR